MSNAWLLLDSDFYIMRSWRWQESGILGLGTEEVERGQGKVGGGVVERWGGGGGGGVGLWWGVFQVGRMRGLEGEIGW